MIIRECAHCIKQFEVRIASDKKKFCNSACAASFNNKKRAKIWNECAYCSKEIINPKYPNAKYCSRLCANRNSVVEKRKKGLLVGTTTLIIKCDNCGSDVRRQGSLDRRFCDNKCRKEHTDALFDSDAKTGKLTDRRLRRYILLTREYKCEMPECGISEWHGKPAPLEVDHIDGNSENNDLSNIRLICSNCHCLTPTYRNKNNGRGRPHRYKKFEENGAPRSNRTIPIALEEQCP